MVVPSLAVLLWQGILSGVAYVENRIHADQNFGAATYLKGHTGSASVRRGGNHLFCTFGEQ